MSWNCNSICGFWGYKGPMLKSAAVFLLIGGKDETGNMYVIVADLPSEAMLSAPISTSGGNAELVYATLKKELSNRCSKDDTSNIKWFSWTKSRIDEVIEKDNGELEYKTPSYEIRSILRKLVEECPWARILTEKYNYKL
ncbi:hypothetical protein [Thermococcus prieurii]